MKNQTVVADLYKLGMSDGKFDKSLKKMYHPRAKVSKQFVNDYNKDWESSGKVYIIDDEATKKYQADAKVLLDARIEKDEALADARDIVVGLVKKNRRKK